MDLGFIEAGFQPIAAFDNDPVAVSSYKQNIGPHIRQIDLRGDSEALADSVSRADVLVAGPPCQGFSTVGLNDPNDARNQLLLRTVEIACQHRPRVVVIENVRGLLGIGFRKYLNRLQSALEEAGYAVTTATLNASEHSVAQHRRRVFIVASRVGVVSLDLRRQPPVTLRGALHGLDKTHTASAHVFPNGGREFAIATAIGPGQKLTNVRAGRGCVHTWAIPAVFGRTNAIERRVLEGLLVARRTQRVRSNGDADPVSAARLTRELGFPTAAILAALVNKGFVRRVGAGYDLTHSFNGKYRRLVWDEPAPTVDTRFGQPRYFLHPDEHRGFSVRETARIQGFPDDYVFPSSGQHAFRLIGNAVPPPLARAVAQQVLVTLNTYDAQ